MELAFVPQEGDGIDLLAREEELQRAPPPGPNGEEYCHAADQRPGHTQRCSAPHTEGIARGDFQRLAGQDGNDDLESHQCNEKNRTPRALFRHPFPEPLRIGEQAGHRLPGENADSRHRRCGKRRKQERPDFFTVFRGTGKRRRGMFGMVHGKSPFFSLLTNIE